MVLALGISLVVSALMARSLMMLRLARADLQRTTVEQLLDGAHLSAAAAIVRAGAGGPYHWALATEAGFADVIAEAEADKVTPATAAGWSDARFSTLGVADPAALKARLAAADDETFADVAALDAAPMWRECAAGLVSSFGQRTDGLPAAHDEPRARPELPAWRVGQTWRIRVTTAAGWRDDRIVRFTGDARHPVAVARRQLSRTNGGRGQCDEVLGA